MKTIKNLKRGFTLIELLVVIAIIGILSSVVLASLNSARAKSRDAKRLSDIKSLQVALELYFDYNKTYPSSIGSLVGDDGFISTLPNDPLGASYVYSMCNEGDSYHLGASLEQVSSALNDDADGNACGETDGWGANDNLACDGTSGGGTQGPHCYDVTD